MEALPHLYLYRAMANGNLNASSSQGASILRSGILSTFTRVSQPQPHPGGTTWFISECPARRGVAGSVCVGLQSGFSKNKLAAQTLLFEQGGMKQ